MLYDLHFRQHYALSTSDDPGNARWKQRSSGGFPGKIMVYSRQRYALNHSALDESHAIADAGPVRFSKKLACRIPIFVANSAWTTPNSGCIAMKVKTDLSVNPARLPETINQWHSWHAAQSPILSPTTPGAT
jgi:hypothetical protein